MFKIRAFAETNDLLPFPGAVTAKSQPFDANCSAFHHLIRRGANGGDQRDVEFGASIMRLPRDDREPLLDSRLSA
jgi:hypothetical protein